MYLISLVLEETGQLTGCWSGAASSRTQSPRAQHRAECRLQTESLMHGLISGIAHLGVDGHGYGLGVP